MKKSVVSLFAVIIVLAVAQSTKATVLYTENFNSYSDGALTNNNLTAWFQTGASGATPVQVASGTAVLGTSGQDVYSAFSTTYTIPDDTSLYFGLAINLNSAQAGGDYFFHFAPTVAEGSLFFGRIFAKSSGAGFVLGYMETSGTGSAVNYGSTVLSFNTSYNLVLSYNNIAGLVNDTASLYVNPTDSVEGNNTAYISGDAWTTVSAENHNVSEVNLRQGSSGNAPALSVDNIIVATSFNDIVTPVPEPATLAIASLGGLACLIAIRRKR